MEKELPRNWVLEYYNIKNNSYKEFSAAGKMTFDNELFSVLKNEFNFITKIETPEEFKGLYKKYQLSKKPRKLFEVAYFSGGEQDKELAFIHKFCDLISAEDDAAHTFRSMILTEIDTETGERKKIKERFYS